MRAFRELPWELRKLYWAGKITEKQIRDFLKIKTL